MLGMVTSSLNEVRLLPLALPVHPPGAHAFELACFSGMRCTCERALIAQLCSSKAVCQYCLVQVQQCLVQELQGRK